MKAILALSLVMFLSGCDNKPTLIKVTDGDIICYRLLETSGISCVDTVHTYGVPLRGVQ